MGGEVGRPVSLIPRTKVGKLWRVLFAESGVGSEFWSVFDGMQTQPVLSVDFCRVLLRMIDNERP